MITLLLMYAGCKKPEPVPAVTMGQVKTGVYEATADAVIVDAGEGLSGYGHCWALHTYPTVNDFKTDLGAIAQTGLFSSQISGLDCSTKYYIRAYIYDGEQYVYSTFEIAFTTQSPACSGETSVTYGGQTYEIIPIGNQCWFRENLNIGTRIDGVLDQTNNSIIEKYCYDDDTANCTTYGGLYQWNEMMQYTTIQGAKGICPTGWHIPTDAEWTTLITYLGGEDVAGGNMKEAGYMHWQSPNEHATNSSGFTALPGGERNIDGSFGYIDVITHFWTSTNVTSYPWYWGLDSYSDDVFRGHWYMEEGLSVRCLKDD